MRRPPPFSVTLPRCQCSRRAVTLIVGVLLGALVSARAAPALVACTAADVSAQDGGCPSGSGACSITKVFSVSDGCVLDFGGRAVTILANGQFDVAPGTATFNAGSLTLVPGGLIEGRGEQSA